jgi:hypothetical protein
MTNAAMPVTLPVLIFATRSYLGYILWEFSNNYRQHKKRKALNKRGTRGSLHSFLFGKSCLEVRQALKPLQYL